MVARRKRASAIAAYIYISRRILTRHENQRALTKCLNGGGFSAASRPPSLLKMTVCANLSCSLKGRVGRCPEQLQSRLVNTGRAIYSCRWRLPTRGCASSSKGRCNERSFTAGADSALSFEEFDDARLGCPRQPARLVAPCYLTCHAPI